MRPPTGRRTAARTRSIPGLRPAAVLAAGAMAIAVAAGALDPAVPATPGAPRRAEDRPDGGRAAPLDLLLITIDTWRADAAGFGGHRPSPTPLLDRLAAGGRVFADAHAHNVVTLPSHTNILTGLYPFQHGVRDNEGFRVPAGVPTLATVLHAAGYATGAFVGAYPLDSWFGLNRGFDVYDDHYPKGSHPDQFLFAERKGDQVVAPALAWWQRQRGRRRFLWVHLFDPHAPYEPAEPYASRFPGSPYLGEVAAADGYLAPLLTPFLAGAETPALIVVTGDHGESLGEHGEQTHGLFAYEATLHVPLLLWGTGVTPGRDDRPARHVDVFPTLLEAAGLIGASAPAAPPGMSRPGRSLLQPAGAAAGEPAETSYFEALSASFNRGWAPLRGVLRQGRKAIALPLPELYDLPHDPGEAHNLVTSDRRMARLLLAGLPKESAWPPPAGAAGGGTAGDGTGSGGTGSRNGGRRQPTAAESANLRSLGYAGGTAPPARAYGPDDDPKRLVALDRRIHAVIDLYQRGRPAEAAALARQVVAARPAMPLGYSLLGEALLQSGRKEEALAAMREARRRGAASDDLLCQLGLTLSELGHPQEGIEVLRPLAASGEPQMLEALAQALSDAGRQEEAAETLRRALAVEPDDAAAHEELG
ncbi:MAG TPA: sulfatase-like hydrolase/transferase, partial [Thermoanaerobaculia bacterium]|nr:sulfatase-like hydrolase/transferase [Thermoanaerobaculia bacterium]